ncbi:MAG: hypothetical protein K6F75_10180, partial [Butyrivibrio sp.]|nr:hypothetical protein [Butyrivibrio sp.]
FDQVVKLPFEETFMNVPARYEEILSIEYGDYMRVFKGGGMHDYPVYHDQEEILRQNLGGNPFRYTFDMNQLLVSVSRYAKRMLEKAGNAAGGNVAGDLSGTGNRKVAVFLPCRAVWWGTMEPLWQKFCADPSMEVHVLPIFYYDCDHNGNIGEKHDERALFPEYLKVEACEKFDFEGIHPDVIVIQQPYDGHDMAFTVHEFFYSGNLLNFTDELIYVPCVDMDPPIDENDKAATAISVFIEQEGVVNADRVVLPNERLRRLYIDTLVALSSEDTRQYWEQKIVAIEGEKAEEKSGDSKDRKTIVYHIGISSLLKYGREAINKIRENLEIFEAASDRLDVIILPQKQLMDNLPQMEPQVFGEFEKTMAEIPAGGNITYDPEQAALLRQDEWDAYYGDPSPLVRKCVERKIPVMIQNYEIRKN